MRNLLLLGADRATVSLYQAHLKSADLALVASETVEPIADFLRLGQPAAVLLDATGSKVDAGKLVSRIRAESEFRTLPVLVLTNGPPGQTTEEIRGDSFTRSFQKPATVVAEVAKAILEMMNASDHAPVVQSVTAHLTDCHLVTANGKNADLFEIDDSSARLVRVQGSEADQRLSQLAQQLSAKASDHRYEQCEGQCRPSRKEGETETLRAVDEDRATATERGCAAELTLESPTVTVGAHPSRPVMEPERPQAQVKVAEAEEAAMSVKIPGRCAAGVEAQPQAPPASPGPGHSQGEEFSLEQKLAAIEAYHMATSELERLRGQLAEERSGRQRIEVEMMEVKLLNEELMRRLEEVAQTEPRLRETIQSLQSELQDSATKLSAAESSLQTQTRECRGLEIRCKSLDGQVAELSRQLSAQTAVEQSRIRQEVNLKNWFAEQKAELARSKTALACQMRIVQRVRATMEGALTQATQELNNTSSVLVEDEDVALANPTPSR